jgi:hypothetical protein
MGALFDKTNSTSSTGVATNISLPMRLLISIFAEASSTATVTRRGEQLGASRAR